MNRVHLCSSRSFDSQLRAGKIPIGNGAWGAKVMRLLFYFIHQQEMRRTIRVSRSLHKGILAQKMTARIT
jgi:hypothetical protein